MGLWPGMSDVRHGGLRRKVNIASKIPKALMKAAGHTVTNMTGDLDGRDHLLCARDPARSWR